MLNYFTNVPNQHSEELQMSLHPARALDYGVKGAHGIQDVLFGGSVIIGDTMGYSMGLLCGIAVLSSFGFTDLAVNYPELLQMMEDQINKSNQINK